MDSKSFVLSIFVFFNKKYERDSNYKRITTRQLFSISEFFCVNVKKMFE